MNKFYESLLNQNRKRPLDAAGQNGEAPTNGEALSADTSPLSKRTLSSSPPLHSSLCL